MSEPYSAMARLQLSPTALKSYLAAPARPTSCWSDWAEMCGREDATGQQNGLPFSLHGEMDFACADRWLSEGDYRSQLRAIVGSAELPSLARFHHDEDGLVTVTNLTVGAECFRSPLWFLATVRGAADHVDGPGGLAVIRNYLWGGPRSRHTMAVLRIEPGRSRFLHPVNDAGAYLDAVRRADAAFDGIGLSGKGEEPPPADDGGAPADLDRV